MTSVLEGQRARMAVAKKLGTPLMDLLQIGAYILLQRPWVQTIAAWKARVFDQCKLEVDSLRERCFTKGFLDDVQRSLFVRYHEILIWLETVRSCVVDHRSIDPVSQLSG
jgi:hypothetical protein